MESPIQTIDQIAASLFEITWFFLLKMPKSSKSINNTATVKPIIIPG
jgi:hypothetical protein